MSPFPNDAFIEYPKFLEESSNEYKLEYAEKMLNLWTKEVENLTDIIYIQDPPSIESIEFENESENENWE